MGKGGLAQLLALEVLGGDVNACCGILRRALSETVWESQAKQTGIGHSTVFNNVIALGRTCIDDNPSLVRPSSVAVLCHVSHGVGDWRSALHFARALPNAPSPSFLSSLLRPKNCSAILKFCEVHEWAVDVPHATFVLAEQYGCWTSALEVAEAMEFRCSMGEQYSMGVLIPYLAASGGWRRAAQLFMKGVAQGSFVDARFVADLVRRTARLKQWQTAFFMLAAAEKTKEAAHICPSDVNFFKDLMSVSPNWVSSLSIFNVAIGSSAKPDRSMVSLLLGQCEEANAWLMATKVYDAAIREGFVSSIDGGSYQKLLRSFHAARQWEKALVALSWMEKVGEASMTTGMGELLEMCQQSGQWEVAVCIGSALLEKASHMPSRTRLAFLLACADGAAWQCSLRVLYDCFEDSKCTPHALFVCAALQACVAARRWEDCLMLLRRAREEEPRLILPALAHRLALKACVGSGQWRESMRLLNEMIAYGLPRDNHTKHVGLWAAALSGDWQLSLNTLKTIPVAFRTSHDHLLVRGATHSAGAVARAIVLKHLRQQVS
uniref:Uncharacterized protein n=1 Tax=Trypanosoma congolense (strain IL3000) TaxID=1068625 RepID=G0UNZ7_TRYCI|nr:conserved hypothetical protein [Trypanosoma congolense IL3000]